MEKEIFWKAAVGGRIPSAATSNFRCRYFSSSCHVMSLTIRADKVPVYSSAAASHINVRSISDEAATLYCLPVCQASWQLFSISPILAFMQLKCTPTLRGIWCDVRWAATALSWRPCSLPWSDHSRVNNASGGRCPVVPPFCGFLLKTVINGSLWKSLQVALLKPTVLR